MATMTKVATALRCAVIQFPGSNCDTDCEAALKSFSDVRAEIVWHKETSLSGYDAVVLPGGFSYGDYLRCGSIARFSPIMAAVRHAASTGVLVLGICNGFQILCESHLLPGALTRNDSLHFICRDQRLRIESTQTRWTSAYEQNQEIVIPLKNGEGGFVADERTLDALEAEGRVVARYLGLNPNGSRRDIAGISNAAGNVVGLMPHPEHAVEELTGPTTDGLGFFTSIISSLLTTGSVNA